MTQEEKKLLLKDLSGRILYTPLVLLDGKKRCLLTGIDDGEVYLNIDSDPFDLSESNIKPYLRPMLSMTDEEEKVFCDFLEFQSEYVTDADLNNKTDMYDWLNAHHFDYRGLISIGLALEAPEDMYKTKL